MNAKFKAKSVPLPIAMILVAAFFLFGLTADRSWSRADASAQKPLALGISASKALEILGTPKNISYDADVQTWFYRTKDNTVKKRCIINQGLVVRVF
ncbi:MAG: hypothetical protein ACI97A_001759 [Planctomycetota bacterium]|jgi:hypothetical protein